MPFMLAPTIEKLFKILFLAPTGQRTDKKQKETSETVKKNIKKWTKKDMAKKN